MTVNPYAFVLLAMTILAGCHAANNTESATQSTTMTTVQAKQLIVQQRNVETIPKPIWRQILSAEQYDIMWKKGTEPAFSGSLLSNKADGIYVSAGCRLPVFHSSTKFKSGTGWPSFWDVFNDDNVVLKDDWSWGMKRTEVLSRCGEHLGHVFDDGPKPTGLRYCINSLALDFIAIEPHQ